MVVEEYGPGATSLGGSGVERGWWHNEIQETSRTAVWCSNAGRQYRAVVSWKRVLIGAAVIGTLAANNTYRHLPGSRFTAVWLYFMVTSGIAITTGTLIGAKRNFNA